ncbi:MAG: GNAT family N-acetyltransferase [Planctomycetota bacterium]|jgi:RimJ/RimL family protein N-acetyltransferase
MNPEILSVKEGLRLRSVDLDVDVDGALPWYQDREVLKGTAALGREEPYDRETVESMFRYLMDMGECWIIEIREGDAWIPIGDVTLSEKDIPIVIGRREYWGRGIARSVLAFLIRRAREQGIEEIGPVEIYRFNEQSIRLFRSLGFRCVSESDEGFTFTLTLGPRKGDS